MKSYREFCDHYCLDPDDIDGNSRRQYKRMVSQFKKAHKADDQVNLGGRPRLSDSEKKSKVVQVRFTQDDFAAIEQLAINAGFKNVSHFIRSNINSWTREHL